MSVTFVHLSDIHFSKTDGGIYDLNEDLRNELEIDASSVVENIGAPSAILVTGDIGFSGHRSEYEIASQWLRRFAGLVGCDPIKAWVTPGNHDVDRDVAKSSLLQSVRDELRSVPLAEIDTRLLRHLKDAGAAELLFAPLVSYNDFADQFACRISHERPYWHFDVPLSSNLNLRVHGLNSTIASDSQDDASVDRFKLVMGSYQIPRRRQRTAHMTLCHHPPSWLRDGEIIEEMLLARASVHLYGHRHKYSAHQIDQSLVLSAGAVHPERDQHQWEPRYNWLVVDAGDTGDGLSVTVFPRVWSHQENRFVADYFNGSDRRAFTLRMRALVHTGTDEGAQEETPSEIQVDYEEEFRLNDETMLTRRRLHYRYFNLPYRKAVDIAGRMKLLEEADKDLTGAQLLNAVLERVKHRNLIEEFSGLVDDAEQGAP